MATVVKRLRIAAIRFLFVFFRFWLIYPMNTKFIQVKLYSLFYSVLFFRSFYFLNPLQPNKLQNLHTHFTYAWWGGRKERTNERMNMIVILFWPIVYWWWWSLFAFIYLFVFFVFFVLFIRPLIFIYSCPIICYICRMIYRVWCGGGAGVCMKECIHFHPLLCHLYVASYCVTKHIIVLGQSTYGNCNAEYFSLCCLCTTCKQRIICFLCECALFFVYLCIDAMQ